MKRWLRIGVSGMVTGTASSRRARSAGTVVGKSSRLLMAALVLLSCTGIRRRLKLTIRKLPNGTTQMPPAVQGAITGHAGLWTRVVFWHTPEGKAGLLLRRIDLQSRCNRFRLWAGGDPDRLLHWQQLAVLGYS
jgi:hypothetical protein